MCTSICLHLYVCMVSAETRVGLWIPRSCSYRCLWVSDMGAGTEHDSLEEQNVLFTSEPSPQSLGCTFEVLPASAAVCVLRVSPTAVPPQPWRAEILHNCEFE